MNRLLPRLLAALIASIAIGFTVTGTASANAPIKLVAGPYSYLSITDDETWSADEHLRVNLAGSVFGSLGAGNGTFNYKTSRCAGGEVRAELVVDAFRWNTDAATATVHLNLYEGASCSTTDLDGQSQFETFTIKSGQNHVLRMWAHNDDEDADDGVFMEMIVSAIPA